MKRLLFYSLFEIGGKNGEKKNQEDRSLSSMTHTQFHWADGDKAPKKTPKDIIKI